MAIALWKLVLKDRFSHLDLWINYLTVRLLHVIANVSLAERGAGIDSNGQQIIDTKLMYSLLFSII